MRRVPFPVEVLSLAGLGIVAPMPTVPMPEVHADDVSLDPFSPAPVLPGRARTVGPIPVVTHHARSRAVK